MDHIDVEIAGDSVSYCVEGKGVDVATLADFLSRVNLLSQTIFFRGGGRQAAGALGAIADLHKGIRWSGGSEFDVVHKETVAGEVHAVVLGVGPFKGMGAGGDVKRIVVPVFKVCTVAELQCPVDIELAHVIESVGSLAHAVGVKGDGTVIGEGVCGLNGGGGVCYSFVAAPHAVGAVIAIRHHYPRIGASVVERELAQGSGLEVDEVGGCHVVEGGLRQEVLLGGCNFIQRVGAVA